MQLGLSRPALSGDSLEQEFGKNGQLFEPWGRGTLFHEAGSFSSHGTACLLMLKETNPQLQVNFLLLAFSSFSLDARIGPPPPPSTAAAPCNLLTSASSVTHPQIHPSCPLVYALLSGLCSLSTLLPCPPPFSAAGKESARWTGIPRSPDSKPVLAISLPPSPSSVTAKIHFCSSLFVLGMSVSLQDLAAFYIEKGRKSPWKNCPIGLEDQPGALANGTERQEMSPDFV